MDLDRRLMELARITRAPAPVVSVYLNTRWVDEHQRDRVRVFLDAVNRGAVHRLYVHRSFSNQRDIVMPAGDHRTAIRMRANEYLRLAGPRVGQFAVREGRTFPVHPRTQAPAGWPRTGSGR